MSDKPEGKGTGTTRDRLKGADSAEARKKPSGERGRPPHVYPPDTGDKVRSLAQYGLTQKLISVIVDIPERTLRSKFAKDLRRGHALASAAVGQTLYQKAINGDTACLIFWAKTQLGWSEARRQVDIVSSDKSVSLSGQAIGPAELDRLERLCDKMDWNAKDDKRTGDGRGEAETGGLLS